MQSFIQDGLELVQVLLNNLTQNSRWEMTYNYQGQLDPKREGVDNASFKVDVQVPSPKAEFII